jgi:hypothetical protein
MHQSMPVRQPTGDVQLLVHLLQPHKATHIPDSSTSYKTNKFVSFALVS